MSQRWLLSPRHSSAIGASRALPLLAPYAAARLLAAREAPPQRLRPMAEWGEWHDLAVAKAAVLTLPSRSLMPLEQHRQISRLHRNFHPNALWPGARLREPDSRVLNRCPKRPAVRNTICGRSNIGGVTSQQTALRITGTLLISRQPSSQQVPARWPSPAMACRVPPKTTRATYLIVSLANPLLHPGVSRRAEQAPQCRPDSRSRRSPLPCAWPSLRGPLETRRVFAFRSRCGQRTELPTRCWMCRNQKVGWPAFPPERPKAEAGEYYPRMFMNSSSACAPDMTRVVTYMSGSEGMAWRSPRSASPSPGITSPHPMAILKCLERLARAMSSICSSSRLFP